MKLFGLVLAGLSKAQAGTDFQVVSCNNENTRAPEMTIKVRDLLIVGDQRISPDIWDNSSIPGQS